MLVKKGESQALKLQSGTYEAVTVNINLTAKNDNTRLSVADFDPSAVTVKTVLIRDGKNFELFNTNLLLLGIFNTREGGADAFFQGLDILAPTSTSKHILLRTVTLKFGDFVKVKSGDMLVTEIKIASVGAFSANVDDANSNIQFDCVAGIGLETRLTTTVFEVIPATTTSHDCNPGDNISALYLLNLDKNDFATQVVNNMALMSDRLDLSLDFNGLVARHMALQDEPAMRYGANLPISASSNTGRVFRGLDYLPQCFIVLKAKEDTEVDGCRVKLALNGPNVSASNNYVAYRKFWSSKQQLIEAEAKHNEHLTENVSKLPYSL